MGQADLGSTLGLIVRCVTLIKFVTSLSLRFLKTWVGYRLDDLQDLS